MEEEHVSEIAQQLEKHQKVAPLIACFVSLLVGVFVLEISCRVFLVDRAKLSSPTQAPYTEYDSTYGWRLKSDFIGTDPAFGNDSPQYRFNRSGFRDIEIDQTLRQPGVRRIVIIGESNGFGLGVNEEQMFSGIVRQKLAATNRDQAFQVINLSVPGYSFDQQLLLLENEGEKYNPTLVVMLLSTDSIFPIRYPAMRLFAPETMTDYAKPYFELSEDAERKKTLILRNQPPPVQLTAEELELWEEQYVETSTLRKLGKYFRFAQYFSDTMRYVNTEHFFGRPEIYPEYSGASTHWQLMTQLLYRYQRNVTKERRDALLVIIPVKENFTLSYVHPLAQLQLASACSRLRLSCLDLLPVFQGNGAKSLYFERHGVLNGEGHKVLAAALSTAIIDQARRQQ